MSTYSKPIEKLFKTFYIGKTISYLLILFVKSKQIYPSFFFATCSLTIETLSLSMKAKNCYAIRRTCNCCTPLLNDFESSKKRV